MISTEYNHHDVYAGSDGENLTVRLSNDMTEARFASINGRHICTVDLDKDEVRKLGEALVRLASRMKRETDD